MIDIIRATNYGGRQSGRDEPSVTLLNDDVILSRHSLLDRSQAACHLHVGDLLCLSVSTAFPVQAGTLMCRMADALVVV